jgi:hypothetical protein
MYGIHDFINRPGARKKFIRWGCPNRRFAPRFPHDVECAVERGAGRRRVICANLSGGLSDCRSALAGMASIAADGRPTV